MRRRRRQADQHPAQQRGDEHGQQGQWATRVGLAGCFRAAGEPEPGEAGQQGAQTDVGEPGCKAAGGQHLREDEAANTDVDRWRQLHAQTGQGEEAEGEDQAGEGLPQDEPDGARAPAGWQGAVGGVGQGEAEDGVDEEGAGKPGAPGPGLCARLIMPPGGEFRDQQQRDEAIAQQFAAGQVGRGAAQVTPQGEAEQGPERQAQTYVIDPFIGDGDGIPDEGQAEHHNVIPGKNLHQQRRVAQEIHVGAGDIADEPVGAEQKDADEEAEQRRQRQADKDDAQGVGHADGEGLAVGGIAAVPVGAFADGEAGAQLQETEGGHEAFSAQLGGGCGPQIPEDTRGQQDKGDLAQHLQHALVREQTHDAATGHDARSFSRTGHVRRPVVCATEGMATRSPSPPPDNLLPHRDLAEGRSVEQAAVGPQRV